MNLHFDTTFNFDYTFDVYFKKGNFYGLFKKLSACNRNVYLAVIYTAARLDFHLQIFALRQKDKLGNSDGTFFFVYAVFISPQHEFVDVGKLTRESFCTRYNEQVAKLAPNLNLTIDENNLKVDGDNFSYNITEKIKIAAQVENNFVREVTVTAAPKTTDESFQALNCYGLVIATLNPELNQDKRGEVLRELKLLETNINENIDASTESGRITYSIKTYGGKVTFTAQIGD